MTHAGPDMSPTSENWVGPGIKNTGLGIKHLNSFVAKHSNGNI